MGVNEPEGRGQTVIIGAGPAGLTAALELGRLGHRATVFEADDVVGGISRSVVFQGCRLDIGGHRFFTKAREVETLWHEILGPDLLVRERISRIFYRQRFFDYPLKPANALKGLGVVESCRVLASYVRSQLFPIADERTFDAWVSNRFGRRLFEIFFKTYTEKVWGMPCSEISSAWAAQRIKNLDLKTAVSRALLGNRTRDDAVVTSLIERFFYPRLGPGMMWERAMAIAADRGVPTHLGTRVTRIHHADGRVHAVDVEDAEGRRRRQPCDWLISAMPLGELASALDPAPPAAVLESAGGLRYRDFLIVGLIVDREHLFPDNWIYVHSPEVRVGRIQNFKNWSPEMVSDPGVSFIGLEYFANRGDDLWRLTDDELIQLGTAEGEALGLLAATEVRAGVVVRMPKAYPVYDGEYAHHVQVLREWLDRLPNVLAIGRNGQHRYNNQDHSMLCGLYAARNVAGASLDVWGINEEESFHEEVREGDRTHGPTGDRLTPAAARTGVDGLLRDAFALYDEVAMGVAIGVTVSLLLLVVTGALLLGVADGPVPMLSLLGHYLFGYRVTWAGLAIGMIECATLGFALGWLGARLCNVLIAAARRDLERRLTTLTTLEPLDGGIVERT
jgi:protoporphyrinogen oxidase